MDRRRGTERKLLFVLGDSSEPESPSERSSNSRRLAAGRDGMKSSLAAMGFASASSLSLSELTDDTLPKDKPPSDPIEYVLSLAVSGCGVVTATPPPDWPGLLVGDADSRWRDSLDDSFGGSSASLTEEALARDLRPATAAIALSISTRCGDRLCRRKLWDDSDLNELPRGRTAATSTASAPVRRVSSARFIGDPPRFGLGEPLPIVDARSLDRRFVGLPEPLAVSEMLLTSDTEDAKLSPRNRR